MKPEHALYAAFVTLGALLAIEAFYKHPTYGAGVRALLAAAKAAAVLG